MFRPKGVKGYAACITINLNISICTR